jgi:hypothetical protein
VAHRTNLEETMKRLEIVAGWGFVWCLLSWSAGCGGITDLGEGAQGGASSTAGAAAGSKAVGSPGVPAPHACESACFEKIRTGSVASCKLCHASKTAAMGGLQSSGLDLESPNITSRLKDVPAKHQDLPPTMPAMCPSGDLLVDTVNPHNSWLLKKIKGQQGACGTQMPQPPTLLRGDEVACIEAYVYCVAGQAAP